MKLLSFFIYIVFVYIATVCYVVAAYYHLMMKHNWSFLRAFMIAIPLVTIEYFFSLHGNHYLHNEIKMVPMDILIITMCFYFINLWLLNYFVLKNKIQNVYKEIFCFGLIICAFLTTTVIK